MHQPTSSTLKNKQIMQTQLITALNALNLNHYFIAQHAAIRTACDDAYTIIATLEINHQTRELLNQDWDTNYPSLEQEFQSIIESLKLYIGNRYGADSVNTINADQATILENTKFQSTMILTQTDLAIHIVHTSQY